MDKKSYSFQKGYGLVRSKDQPAVKKEIMSALSITSRPAWGARLNGIIEPKISEAHAIEAIFKKYGVTDPWGEDEPECNSD